MENIPPEDSPTSVSEHRRNSKGAHIPRIIAIRSFVAVFAVAIIIDTIPSTWTSFTPIKGWINNKLSYLNLSQGDWSLFAPNPILNNGMIVAEVVDSNKQLATWNTPDWANASVWQKFYRYRYLNYCRRVGNNRHAFSDLADYLHDAIPGKEQITPMIRWSESNEILPPTELVPPIVDIKLYKYRHRMILSPENRLPKQSETLWGYHGEFLLHREYSQ